MQSLVAYLKRRGSSLEDLRDQSCVTLEGREFQRTKAFPQIKYAVGWADLTTSAGETGHTLSTLTGVRVRPGDLEVQVPCTPRDAGLHTACGWAPAGLQALEYSLDGPVSRHTFPSWRKKKKKKAICYGVFASPFGFC